jgi:hypothetical protein
MESGSANSESQDRARREAEIDEQVEALLEAEAGRPQRLAALLRKGHPIDLCRRFLADAIEGKVKRKRGRKPSLFAGPEASGAFRIVLAEMTSEFQRRNHPRPAEAAKDWMLTAYGLTDDALDKVLFPRKPRPRKTTAR